MLTTLTQGAVRRPLLLRSSVDQLGSVMVKSAQRHEAGDYMNRLVSLDVFRGITIAAMVLVNNPGSWSKNYWPLEHVVWNGWTPTDLIFPFFLFIVGVAIPFSFAKRLAGMTRGELLGHIWLRALSLVVLGELLTGFPFVRTDPLNSGFYLIRLLRWVALIFCSV